jgi:hypothetical protein
MGSGWGFVLSESGGVKKKKKFAEVLLKIRPDTLVKL